MMKKITAIIPSLALMLSVFGTPVMAQTIDDGTIQTQQGGTTDPRTGATTTAEDDGINWWWVLPLLAIPVIWMMTRRKEDDDRDRRRADARTGKARFEGEI
jgi:hypothetical protein